MVPNMAPLLPSACTNAGPAGVKAQKLMGDSLEDAAPSLQKGHMLEVRMGQFLVDNCCQSPEYSSQAFLAPGLPCGALRQ